MSRDRVDVFVGGQCFSTTWTTLSGCSRFFSNLETETSKTQSLTLGDDHDPATFYHLLEVLRDPRYPLPLDFDGKAFEKYGIARSRVLLEENVAFPKEALSHPERTFQNRLDTTHRLLDHAHFFSSFVVTTCYDPQFLDLYKEFHERRCGGESCRFLHMRTSTFLLPPTKCASEPRTGDLVCEWSNIPFRSRCEDYSRSSSSNNDRGILSQLPEHCDRMSEPEAVGTTDFFGGVCQHSIDELWVNMSPHDLASVGFSDATGSILKCEKLVAVPGSTFRSAGGPFKKECCLATNVHLRIRYWNPTVGPKTRPNLLVRMNVQACKHHICPIAYSKRPNGNHDSSDSSAVDLSAYA